MRPSRLSHQTQRAVSTDTDRHGLRPGTPGPPGTDIPLEKPLGKSGILCVIVSGLTYLAFMYSGQGTSRTLQAFQSVTSVLRHITDDSSQISCDRRQPFPVQWRICVGFARNRCMNRHGYLGKSAFQPRPEPTGVSWENSRPESPAAHGLTSHERLLFTTIATQW